MSVSGEVKVNGAPLPNASVQFHPLDPKGSIDHKASPAVGLSDSSGKFSLKTPNEGDGAFPGNYKVTVEATTAPNLTEEQKKFPGASSNIVVKSLVAPEYTEVSKSPLTQTIPSTGPIVLEVKPPAK